VRRVRLVHWDAIEADERVRQLRALGYRVDARPVTSGTIRELPRDRMDALVVDLSRLPSQGRDAAVAVRRSKPGRRVPIVFAGGTPEKVERVRETLPDAAYANWDEIGEALERAIEAPVVDPVVPASALAAYAATPLPKKLGIGEDSVVVLIGAPEGFELGPLPEGAVVRRGNRGSRDLTLAFVWSPPEAERLWDKLSADARIDDLWIVWAKKASPLYSGVTQANVRGPGLACGFVDFKVAAIDETWSGLRFKRRA
jgi:CheY-like chemotaxis protein